jgi:uncharacterized membrane protein
VGAFSAASLEDFALSKDINTKPGDLAVHAGSYHHFMLGVKWVAIVLAAMVAFLTLWFCTTTGFFGALITGLIILAVGIYAMNHGLAHSSEGETVDHA